MQYAHPLLSVRRTRDQVRDVLRGMISNGEFSNGARLEEVSLSTRMGISRTPLREALIALEEEGWVRSEPNKGFSVVAADEAMVRELYPILSALEAAAVTLAAPRLQAAVSDLRSINEKLASETRAARQYDLDAAFHARLVRDCGNARLLRLIQTHWAQARRFDGAQARGTADRDGSCREHEDILAALEEGRISDAAMRLVEHWTRGVETVTTWLRRKS